MTSVRMFSNLFFQIKVISIPFLFVSPHSQRCNKNVIEKVISKFIEIIVGVF